MVENFANRIPAATLRRWILRAFFVGLAAGVMAGIAALMN
jgi:hypothetical protein